MRLISNSNWNLLAFLVALGANFVAIPVVVDRIGLPMFGAAGLVIATLAPFVVVGTVLGQATLREVASRLSPDDVATCSRFVRAALTLCTGACLLVTAVVIAFGDDFIGMLTSGKEQVLDWQLGLIAALVGWAAQQYLFVIQAAMAATQQYASLAKASAIAALANVTAIIGIVSIAPTALGYLVGMSAGFIASAVIVGVAAVHAAPWLLRSESAGASEYRALFDFGKWQGSAHVAGAIGLQVDRYALGAMTSVTLVGHYNIAMRLQEVVYMAILKATEVLFPHFSATSDEPVATRAAFFSSASWATNTIAVCALAPLVPLSWSLLALWIGPVAADGAAHILQILAIAGILGAGTNLYTYQAMGTGQSPMLARINITHAIATVMLTIPLIATFGGAAAGVGLLITNALRLGWVIWVVKKSFSPALDARTLWVCCIAPLLSGVVMAWAWRATGSTTPQSWHGLAGCYALIASSTALLTVALSALNAAGRRQLTHSARTAAKLVGRGR